MLKIFRIIVRQVVKCHERNIQGNDFLSHLSFYGKNNLIETALQTVIQKPYDRKVIAFVYLI